MLKKTIIIMSVFFTFHLGAMEKLAETGSEFLKRAKEEHSLLLKKYLLQDNYYRVYSPSKKVLVSIKPAPIFLSPCKLLDIEVVGCCDFIEPKKLPVNLKNISVVFDQEERYVVIQGSLSKPRCSRNLSIPYAATFRLPETD